MNELLSSGLPDLHWQIEVAPNLARLLHRWGVLDKLRPSRIEVRATSLRRE